MAAAAGFPERKGSSHMLASSLVPLVSQASLTSEKNSIINICSNELKMFDFIGTCDRIAYLETLSVIRLSYLDDLSAKPSFW